MRSCKPRQARKGATVPRSPYVPRDHLSPSPSPGAGRRGPARPRTSPEGSPPLVYEALARKYRPRTFEELVGQQPIVRTLTNAIEAGRVHHAYVFSGVRGVGKTTVARIFAKALNCEKGPTPVPCLACPPCTAIAAGQGMDAIEMDAASRTGVDDVRDLIDTTRYAP